MTTDEHNSIAEKTWEQFRSQGAADIVAVRQYLTEQIDYLQRQLPRSRSTDIRPTTIEELMAREVPDDPWTDELREIARHEERLRFRAHVLGRLLEWIAEIGEPLTWEEMTEEQRAQVTSEQGGVDARLFAFMPARKKSDAERDLAIYDEYWRRVDAREKAGDVRNQIMEEKGLSEAEFGRIVYPRNKTEGYQKSDTNISEQ